MRSLTAPRGLYYSLPSVDGKRRVLVPQDDLEEYQHRRAAYLLRRDSSPVEPGKAWTLAEAAEEVAHMQPHLHAVGWYCTLAGSTLTAGVGRDLDLVFLPVFLNSANRDWLVRTLTKRWGSVIEDHYSTMDRVRHVVFEDEDMRLYDCMFWRTVNDELKVQTARDAMLDDDMDSMGG